MAQPQSLTCVKLLILTGMKDVWCEGMYESYAERTEQAVRHPYLHQARVSFAIQECNPVFLQRGYLAASFSEKCCIQFHDRAEMLIRIHSFQTISSIKYFSFLYSPSLQTKRIFWLLTNKKLIIDSLIMSGSNLISWLLVPEHPSWGEKGIQEWQYNFTAYGSHLFISRYHKALNIPVCFFLQRNVWIIKIQTIWQAVSLCREGFMLNDRQMFGEPKESPLPSCLPLLSLTLNS